MPPLPNQPPLAPPVPPPPSGGRREPEIVVMPEKYFGMSLKMDSKTQAEMEKPLPPPPPPKPVAAPKPPIPGPLPHRPVWPFVLLAVILLLLVGGGFVWFNRTLFFPKQPATPVVTQPAVVPPPSAPSNLVASVASGTQATALAWVDTSGNETGFRIERREGTSGTFLPVTNLPANSSNFLDISVQSGRNYTYRVVAVGQNAESGPSNESSVSIVESAPPTPVAALPPGGLDSDSDGLTDAEEPIYGTNINQPDTDKDGFLDGNEVFHLYNPAAQAPVRLIDSGLVVPLVAPAGWSIYVPKPWTSSLDKTDGSQATIRTNQGESFKIRIEDNPTHQSLMDWYLAKNPGETAASPHAITTKGGLEGLLGADRLEAYFAWDGKVFVLTYDIGTKPYINFRTTYEMMLNSLRLSGAPVLDEQAANSGLTGPGQFLPTGSATSTSATTTGS